jgi:hypothetical protein
MSVGSGIALSCVYSGFSGTIKLADFDTLETANLNRLRESLALCRRAESLCGERLPVRPRFDGDGPAGRDLRVTTPGVLIGMILALSGPYGHGGMDDRMKLSKQDAAALGSVFDALCKSEASAQELLKKAIREAKKDQAGGGTAGPARPPSAGSSGDTPFAFIEYIEQLSVSAQANPPGFAEELESRRNAFQSALWKHVDTRRLSRSRIQSVIDRIDLFQGDSSALVKGVPTSCQFAKVHGVTLLLELKSAE